MLGPFSALPSTKREAKTSADSGFLEHTNSPAGFGVPSIGPDPSRQTLASIMLRSAQYTEFKSKRTSDIKGCMSNRTFLSGKHPYWFFQTHVSLSAACRLMQATVTK